MTGPEHYAEAERLLTEVTDFFPSNDDASDQALVMALHQRAQVHATLALAAATDSAARPGPVNMSDAMPTGYGR